MVAVPEKPSIHTLATELSQVVSRHNELAQEHGHGLLAAVLVEAADKVVKKGNVDVEVDQGVYEGDPYWQITFDETKMALLGLPMEIDPSKLPDDVQQGVREAAEASDHYGRRHAPMGGGPADD